MRKAVFLDRDGVINRAEVRSGKPYPPATVADLAILPGVRESLIGLRAAGYLLIVVTNQPDVARGTQDKSVVEAINDLLTKRLPIDEIHTCYHDGPEQCRCRKPEPGFLIDSAEKHGIDLAGSYMIGDRWRDIEAGRRAGCKTIFIDYGYQEKQPDSPNHRVSSLVEATHIILTTYGALQ